MSTMSLRVSRMLFGLLVALIAGCTPEQNGESSTAPAADPPLAEVVATDLPAPEVVIATEPPVFQPTATLSEAQYRAATIALTDAVLSHRVNFVERADSLEVRSGPGAGNDSVGKLRPGATSVEVTGEGATVAGDLWLPVKTDAVEGWVNSVYLTADLSSELFCDSRATGSIVRQFTQAVESGNGESLAQLIHPSRGLRVHTHWWNPEIRFTEESIGLLFASSKSLEWGVEDGSGADIEGSFSDVILPLLRSDLLGSEVMECNAIAHGSTAGLVQLPYEYDGINYLSVYRPSAEGAHEYDWGSWVIGVEPWQGKLYVSFLVHYEWEI